MWISEALKHESVDVSLWVEAVDDTGGELSGGGGGHGVLGDVDSVGGGSEHLLLVRNIIIS